jgi:Ca2+-transporting ATPase
VAVHVPIAALALLPPLLDWPLLLAPIHIVVLELVLDPTCSIVFELEPPAADVMRRAPRGRREHLFELRRVTKAIGLGVAAFIGPFAVVASAQLGGTAPGTVRALGFAALIAAEVALVFAVRGRLRLIERNYGVRWMVPAVAALVGAMLLIPVLRVLFGFDAVPWWWLGAAAVIGAGPVLLHGWLESIRPSGRLLAAPLHHSQS